MTEEGLLSSPINKRLLVLWGFGVFESRELIEGCCERAGLAHPGFRTHFDRLPVDICPPWRKHRVNNQSSAAPALGALSPPSEDVSQTERLHREGRFNEKERLLAAIRLFEVKAGQIAASRLQLVRIYLELFTERLCGFVQRAHPGIEIFYFVARLIGNHALHKLLGEFVNLGALGFEGFLTFQGGCSQLGGVHFLRFRLDLADGFVLVGLLIGRDNSLFLLAASDNGQRSQHQQTQKSSAFHSFHLFALSKTTDISHGQHRQAQLYSPAAEYPEISGQDIDFS